ncbi:MAG: hypothetical protein QOC95_2623 [Thermoleophilaceae bacterium]|nr:hypothetical protein [Thermoleophilaceae bacterium]
MPEAAQGGTARVVGGATVAGFLAFGVASYLNQPWTKPFARRLGAKNGRDLMLNWPVRVTDHRRAGTGTHAAAAAIFATYPLAWWLGWDHGRRARPRGPA